MHIHDLVKEPLSLRKCPVIPGTKARVNIVALGDVGTTMLIGLKLLLGIKSHQKFADILLK